MPAEERLPWIKSNRARLKTLAEEARKPVGSAGKCRLIPRFGGYHRPMGITDFSTISLRTERLLLRPLRETDAPGLFSIYSDPRVTRYLSRPAWTDIGQAQQKIAQHLVALQVGEYLRLGIEVQPGGELVGDCTLFHLDAQCRRAEIGYTLGFDAWGRGFMHEALQALVNFGFGEMKLNRIEADIDPRNLASAGSLERLGFRFEGLLRERWIVDDEVSDSGLYGLLCSDWQAASR